MGLAAILGEKGQSRKGPEKELLQLRLLSVDVEDDQVLKKVVEREALWKAH